MKTNNPLYDKLMKIKKTSDFVKEIEKIGYHAKNKKGNGSSHVPYINESGKLISVSIHEKELPIGTKRNIVKRICGIED